MKTYERVTFRLIHTPCCGTMLCFVNPRLPNYCSECGTPIFSKIKNSQYILFTDENAGLKYTGPDEAR